MKEIENICKEKIFFVHNRNINLQCVIDILPNLTNLANLQVYNKQSFVYFTKFAKNTAKKTEYIATSIFYGFLIGWSINEETKLSVTNWF